MDEEGAPPSTLTPSSSSAAAAVVGRISPAAAAFLATTPAPSPLSLRASFFSCCRCCFPTVASRSFFSSRSESMAFCTSTASAANPTSPGSSTSAAKATSRTGVITRLKSGSHRAPNKARDTGTTHTPPPPLPPPPPSLSLPPRGGEEGGDASSSPKSPRSSDTSTLLACPSLRLQPSATCRSRRRAVGDSAFWSSYAVAAEAAAAGAEAVEAEGG
mmetsp:Transcript_20075/g.41194  ORF Transcript_20075/g.41194 Transcript_20075/m.41194 type:complete len:216 (+) Transcript_20075:161-808(+)